MPSEEKRVCSMKAIKQNIAGSSLTDGSGHCRTLSKFMVQPSPFYPEGTLCPCDFQECSQLARQLFVHYCRVLPAVTDVEDVPRASACSTLLISLGLIHLSMSIEVSEAYYHMDRMMAIDYAGNTEPPKFEDM
jgi:hypothetical protein